jgi:uncharacterized protein YdhG (YjbR/CyaY superfamily)
LKQTSDKKEKLNKNPKVDKIHDFDRHLKEQGDYSHSAVKIARDYFHNLNLFQL